MDSDGWTMQPPLRCAAHVVPEDALSEPKKKAHGQSGRFSDALVVLW